MPQKYDGKKIPPDDGGRVQRRRGLRRLVRLLLPRLLRPQHLQERLKVVEGEARIQDHRHAAAGQDH